MKSARVDRNQATLQRHYREYGLDGDVWERPGVPNLIEIEAQIERLFELIDADRPAHTGCPPLVIRHKVTELLGCFTTQISGVSTAVGVPSRLAQLIARLLDVQNDIRGGTKEPNALAAAAAYTKEHPAASQNAVAKAVDVTPTTVGTWFKEGKLPNWNGPRQ